MADNGGCGCVGMMQLDWNWAVEFGVWNLEFGVKVWKSGSLGGFWEELAAGRRQTGDGTGDGGRGTGLL